MDLNSVSTVNAGEGMNRIDVDSEIDASPDLQTKKRIIELILERNEKKPEKTEEEKDVKIENRNDSVEISQKAIEMQRDSRKTLTVSGEGGEKLEISLSSRKVLRVNSLTSEEAELQSAEPLVFDLNGNGIELTDVRDGKGVNFDITGTGKESFTSWVLPDDGLLVYDRNGNGSIDSGKELFGDQNGAVDGFEELAKFDSDLNSLIDENDEIYAKLQIWRDIDQNGESSSDELAYLKDYGISEISLEKNDRSDVIAGNRVEGYSQYLQNGRAGLAGEVFFNYYDI